MIGKQIGEIKGKATGQRVLDADDPAMDTSVTASGNFAGSPVNVILTYTSRLVTKGVLHGWGKGVMMTSEEDVASYTGEAIEKIDSSGNVSWRGSLFYNSSASGKLAPLRNIVAVLEAEVDAQGNFIEKTWEWN